MSPETPLYLEEAVSREQVIWNNAYLMKPEDKVASLEPGKRADLVFIDQWPPASRESRSTPSPVERLFKPFKPSFYALDDCDRTGIISNGLKSRSTERWAQNGSGATVAPCQAQFNG